MSLIEQSQELVEITELVGREIEVILHDLETAIKGKLHSISNHGILIRTLEDYTFYPWNNISSFYHIVNGKKVEPTKSTEMPDPEPVEEEIEIVDDPLRTVKKIIESKEDYNAEYYDNDEEEINIDDEEGETCINIDVTEPQNLTVFYEKDFALGKRIAKELKIPKIIRDY